MKYKDVFYTTKHGFVPYYDGDTRTYIASRYRFDPIPGSGESWYHPNINRNPKTTQERRHSFAYPEFVRGKRRSRYLPHEWDEFTRTDYYDRSWKCCTKRKNQWK
jgi:hypothetical protein